MTGVFGNSEKLNFRQPNYKLQKVDQFKQMEGLFKVWLRDWFMVRIKVSSKTTLNKQKRNKGINHYCVIVENNY